MNFKLVLSVLVVLSLLFVSASYAGGGYSTTAKTTYTTTTTKPTTSTTKPTTSTSSSTTTTKPTTSTTTKSTTSTTVKTTTTKPTTSTTTKSTTSTTVKTTTTKPTTSTTVETTSTVVFKPPELSAYTVPLFSNYTAGQTITLTANAVGGTPPFTYQWYNDTSGTPAIITGATSKIYAATAGTTGLFFYHVIIKDSSSPQQTAYSFPDSIVFVKKQLVVSIKPTSGTFDVGQTLTITSVVTGNVLPVTYQWYNDSTGTPVAISGAILPTLIRPASSPSTVKYYLVASESSFPFQTGQSSVGTYVINSALSVSAAPSTATYDTGQTIKITATPSGGTAPYSYQWYNDTSGSSPIPGAIFTTYTATAGPTGTFKYNVKATDSAATPTSATSSPSSIVNVNAAPTVTLAASPSPIDAGQQTTFTATITNPGTAPDTFNWAALPAGLTLVSGCATSSSTCTVSTSPSLVSQQIYTESVTTTDSATTPVTSGSASASVTVNPTPAVTLASQNTAIESDQSNIFTATITQPGTGSDSYSWTLPAGVTSSASDCTPTTATCTIAPIVLVQTLESVSVTITDSATTQVTSSPAFASVTAYPVLQITAQPSVQTPLDAGQSIPVNAFAFGGSGVYTNYLWTSSCPGFSDPGNTNSFIYAPLSASFAPIIINHQSLNTLVPFVPAGPGCTFNVKVTDSFAATNTASTGLIAVTPVPSVSVSPSSQTVDVGQTITLTASLTSPGSGGDSYQWYNGTISDPISGATSLTYAPTAGALGTFNYFVVVTDSNLGTGQSNTGTVIVSTTPTVSVAPSSQTVDVGESITLTATPSGGTSPFTYQWYNDTSGSSPISGATASVYAPTAGALGTFDYYVVATDSATTPVSAKSSPDSIVNVDQVTASTSVSCPSFDVSDTTTCTAMVTGYSPTGTVTLVTSDLTGSFTTANPCTLVSGTCQVTYTDTVVGTPTVTATYSGDSNNNAGVAGTNVVTVNPKLIADVTMHVSNDEDSGFPSYWALDNYTKNITVYEVGPGSFYANTTYNGLWNTFAGALSPQAGITEPADGTGNMVGGYHATFTADLLVTPTEPTSGDLGPFNFGGTKSDILLDSYNTQVGDPTPTSYTDFYFSNVQNFNEVTWGWTYNYITPTSPAQTWINDYTGSSGDIITVIQPNPSFDGALCNIVIPNETLANSAVQSAINSAASGSVICVAAGTYPEQLSITKPLTIVGQGASTIIAPPAVSPDTTSFTSGHPLSPIILVKGTTNANILRLEVDGSTSGGAITSCATNFFGIVYQDASGTIAGTSVNNVELPISIFGCQSGDAIYVQSDSVHSGTSSVNIQNNTVVAYDKNGITCNEQGTTCNIINNTVTGAGPTPLTAQNGVQIGFGATGSIINNNVQDNSYDSTTPGNENTGNYVTADAQSTGILIFASPSIEISDNHVSLNDLGVAIAGDGTFVQPNVTVENNFLTNNYDDALVFDSFNGTSKNNQVSGSPVGLLVTDSFGDATLTSMGDTFTSVTTDCSQYQFGGSFSATGRGTCFTDPTFAASCDIIIPNESATNSALQSTISGAPSGSTICVSAGTYPEQLTINKPLTIVGQGTSTIISPSSVSSDTTSYSSGNPLAPIILVKGTTHVNIQRLEVNGATSGAAINSCAPTFFGIAYQDASGTIAGTTVTNVELAPVDFGCQSGDGIYVQSDSAHSGTSSVNVQNNTVSNYQKNGITCVEQGTTCEIINNTISGVGPNTQIAQNGAEVAFGAVGNIDNNNVQGNSYSNAGNTGNYITASAQATGVLVYASPSVDINNNKISLNDIGAFVGGDGTFVQPNDTVQNNQVSSNYDDGIVFDSYYGISKDNQISDVPVGLLVIDSVSNAAVISNGDTFSGTITTNCDAYPFSGTFTSIGMGTCFT